MGGIEYSFVAWMAISLHAYLMVKTDFFGGRMDALGVQVRRGPHVKPPPEKK